MRKKSKFRLITVSGSAGSGKSLLVKLLAQALNWPIVSASAKQRENAKKYQLKDSEINQLPAEVHQNVDRMMIKQIQQGKAVILESRLGGWQAKDYSDVLRILCTAEEKTKIKRYAQRENLSTDQAAKEIRSRDSQDQQKWLELYNIEDYLNPKYYNLTIKTDKMTPSEEVKKVMTKL